MATTPCPRCGVELDARTSGRARLLACPDCGGVWLDRADAERILEHRPGALQHILLSRRVAATARIGYDIETPVRCPFDAEPLTKAEMDGVQVDSCRVHGTWFDAGEVHRIANANTSRPQEGEEPDAWKTPPGRASSSSSPATFEEVLDGLFEVLDEVDRRR
jgi:Zn-finger nucleic acid-binding protein